MNKKDIVSYDGKLFKVLDVTPNKIVVSADGGRIAFSVNKNDPTLFLIYSPSIIKRLLHYLLISVIMIALGFLLGLIFTPGGITFLTQNVDQYQNGERIEWPMNVEESK